MSALVVDTSSWVSYLAGTGSERIEPALEQGRLYLPVVVAAEVLSGRLGARHRMALEALFADLPPLGTEMEHWFRVGKLRSDLGAKGLSVSTPDAHVAQCALDVGAELLTEDEVFGRIARHTRLRVASR